MKLELYNRLKKELLGDKAALSEQHSPAYQKLVERYAAEAESGLKKWGRDAIRGWLDHYNRLMSRPVRLRYYQILALYFTEAVLREQRLGQASAVRRNMLAYWMATGSGKTLLMHLNILQYIDHIGGLRAFDELQVILTTPGVNLIEQHRRELTPIVDALNRLCANRIKLTVESTASLLNHEPGYFALPPSRRVFRLVLVDEGHIGLAGGGKEAGAFKKLRHHLADYSNAFLFEYSATYHGISEGYLTEYGEQIVYDYNYYRFFLDGYGKDYDIRRIGANRIAGDAECWENFGTAFATLAGKLRIYEELRITAKEGLGFSAAFSDRPLIAFMGNTVEDSKKEGSDDEVSDIRKLLAFLAQLPAEERENLAPVFNGEIRGVLTLTRCPAVLDEIYLSWGDGAYWGIVNVGNGEKFFNDCDGHPQFRNAGAAPLLQLRKRAIVERHFRFAEVDGPHSPINVLIGSRKFAEGWNCYRVSVIGLINLGASKGNKIIQIYGRGVRLKGLNHDGKRQIFDHNGKYQDLELDDTPGNRLRRLETLNVFSLRATYLQKFLEELGKEIPWWLERTVKVETQNLALGDSQESFADYAPKLRIFKVGRDDSEPRLLATRKTDGKWHWRYLAGGAEETGELARCSIQLDFRPDGAQGEHNLAQDLRNWLVMNGAFLPLAHWRERLDGLLAGRRLQLLRETGNGVLRAADLDDLLAIVDALTYHQAFAEMKFGHRENLLWQTVSEAAAKLHHKLLYDLNKRRYRYDEPLTQATDNAAGDFIDRYKVRLEFSDEKARDEFDRKYPSPALPRQMTLDLREPPHIYGPLYPELEKNDIRALHAPKLKSVSISPDALNPGERKFVADLHGFLRHPLAAAHLRKWNFYLLRNVESLRSVGVYLDTETRAYFPDFVLWAVGGKRTHILLIDPKGQSGIQDWHSLNGINAKALLATSGQLQELARELEKRHRREFRVDSFILLPGSSLLAKSGDEQKLIAEMEKHHILRLDWDWAPDHRCYLERMFTLAGLWKG